MDQVNIQIGGNSKTLSIEESTNELLGELNFILGWSVSDQFIMAYDFDKDRLVIQGAAPYDALSNQEIISTAIEAHYM